MSALAFGEERGLSELHICRAPGRYIGQIRPYGHRRWQTVTRKHQRAEFALSKAVRKMTQIHKRARVLWVGDDPSYYDPFVAMEAHRA